MNAEKCWPSVRLHWTSLFCVLAMALQWYALPGQAAATNIVSRPAGYVRIAVSPSNQVLSAIPFRAFTNTVPGVLRDQLTGGSTSTVADNVLKWDSGSQAFITFWRDLSGVWHQDGSGAETTNRLLPGEGFWVVNRQTTNQAVYLAGHAVLDATNALSMNALLNLIAYPFSTKIGVNASDLFNDGAAGGSAQTNADQITETISNTISWLYFNTNSAFHNQWVFDTSTVSSLELLLGRGYWYNRYDTNAFVWSEARPYPNPFPSDGAAPAITNITFNVAGDQATLVLNAAGSGGERLEVYYQNVGSTNSFHTTNGWALAILNLNPGGSTNLSWTDDGSGGRGAVNTVFSRFYLVGRGDIDSDADSLPDAREIYVYHTNPNGSDTDGDGMPDGWETQYGLNPLVNDAASDGDGDSLSNLNEYLNNTDPTNADSDGDGLPDGWEVSNNLNARSDSVTNGLIAWWAFGDASGSTASNSVSTNYTGSLQNMGAGNWTTGLLGGALEFDGVDEYVTVTQNTAVVTEVPLP